MKKTFFVLCFSLLAGCAGSPYSVSRMSQEELRQVSDEVLCRSYNFRGYWEGQENPKILAEVMRRGLDCSAEGRARRILEEDPEYAKITKSSFGTGFAISTKGRIVTAYHVIKDSNIIKVHLTKDTFVLAKVLHRDPINDLAVLQIEKSTPNFLQVALMRSVRMGDRVFTMGFPVSALLGQESKYTEGVVSSLSGIKDASSFLQITVPVQPGNSGGALVNEKGEVVGIITSSAAILPFIEESGTLPQNVNWAVKADYLRPLIELPKAGKIEFDREQLIEYVKKSTFFIETE